MLPTTQSTSLQGLSPKDQILWKDKLCGLACLASLTWENSNYILDSTLEDDGWDEEKWWRHDALIRFLEHHGYTARTLSYRIFPSQLRSDLIWHIFLASLDIPSGSHLVIVSGYDPAKDALTYLDPGWDMISSGEKNISWKWFLKIWRRYGILIEKKS